MTQTLAPSRQTSLWRNRNFLLLWLGQSLSLIGDWFFLATITIWIIDELGRGQSWLLLALSAVPLTASLPTLLIGPLAGVFVDRWNPRRTMLLTDLLRLVLVGLFLGMTLLMTDLTWLLIGCFVVLLLCATGSQFFLPSRLVLVADIVEMDKRPSAFGSLQQANYLAQILGPALAIPLYLSLGPAWAFALDAFTFLISFLTILALQPLIQEGSKVLIQKKRGYWSEFRAGLRFFWGNRVLIHLLLIGMIYMIGGMAYNAFEYLFGLINLHIPEPLLGLYVACFGIGILAGIPLTAALARRLGEGKVMPVCFILFGLTMLVLSRMQSMIPGMICGILLGLLASSTFVTVHPLMLRVTPRELVGRVMAFHGPMITVASLFGGLLAGSLASTILKDFHATFLGMSFGTLDTIFAAIGILMVCAGIYGIIFLPRAIQDYEHNRREANDHEQE